MGLWSRLNRAVRANLNSWVQATEDPEKVLDETVAKMQTSLMQMRQSVAQAIATQKRTERQQAQARTLAEEWYNRANLALGAGDEIRAREALSQRQAYLTTAKTLGTHLQQQAQIVTNLKETMGALERKIADARTRRDLYVIRARSAAASQQLHEMMEQLNPGTGLGALDRMEEKVIAMETQAAAMAELSDLAEGDSLESRFAALEAPDEASLVESELAALKAKRLHPPQS